jgi:hypothetical protein
VVHKHRIARDSLIQMPYAMTSGGLASYRHKEGEALHGDTRFTSPEVIQPNQTKRERSIGVQRVFGRAHRGQACGPFS